MLDDREELKYAVNNGIEQVARNLLSLKVDIEIIQKSTGLSKEAIEKLR